MESRHCERQARTREQQPVAAAGNQRVEVVTYSRSITFIPTYTCAFACGYCAFARPTPLAPLSAAETCFARGVRAGCREVLIMSGEGVMAFPWIRAALWRWGFRDYQDYLYAVCRLALERGLLPHVNIGNQSEAALRRLRPVCASMGMMLETTNALLLQQAPHRHAPNKHPQRRLATLAAAGRAQVPFTTGLLIGIGETWDDRRRSLEAIAELHQQYGHIQEVIVQPLTPHPRTTMAASCAPDLPTLVAVVQMARALLPDDVVIQIPPNLIPEAEGRRQLLLAGARDFGGISPEQDHINPHEPWLPPEHYAAELAAWGFALRPRLAVYPRFHTPDWLAPEVYRLVTAVEQPPLCSPAGITPAHGV